MSLPLVIAHRGDSSRALENSREAVRLALAVPADMIELDIRKSRDNHLYVIHDQETGRTADGNVDIEQAEADEIAAVRLKNGEPVPALKEVLELVAGKAVLNFEIKSDGAGGLCAAHILGAGYRGPVVISSFKEREVLDARRVMPGARYAEIFDSFSAGDLRAYAAKGYNMVSLRRKTVTRELVSSCHEQRIKVFVWTVDEEEDMKKFVEWGVDGIYTNRPGALKDMLSAGA